MDANINDLYSELRNTRQELLERLMNGTSNPIIKPILLEELHDVERTIAKLEQGNYGMCELSGELLPTELLKEIPTLQSKDDYTSLGKFYRKALF
ncbi:hypothetical protein [Bacillus mesophilum]|uniref:DksA C4-type domain-containing protein n=1 Tax=Bacillus mesophilum TaxID=1071718 RepID=A0A7V7RPT3_9BACI|nr:hypothetical protein [Bacillus mesophilum]KAB2335343.1 hypothetical protein F7732_01870 [Bacillus mesophilum]